jgi:phosphatidate cytidylyltransferase
VNSQLGARFLTALVGVPALVWAIGWGGEILFSWLVFLGVIVALWEYHRIAFRSALREQAIGIFAGGVLAAAVLLYDSTGASPWLAGVAAALFSIHLFSGGTLADRFNHLCWTLLGVIYVGFLLPHAALVYRLVDGSQWIFFILIVVMIGDTAAYVVGKSIGKTKLYPEISPGKTVEGAIGSTAASLIAGVVAGQYLLPAHPLFELIGLSFVLSLLGQVGDLFESWIKRVFGVKDSSAILPGHGGLLDRLDSLIFPLVFIAYYTRIFPR